MSRPASSSCLPATCTGWAPLPDAADVAAVPLWLCMRVAELRSALPESLLHAVRVRRKRLGPELHALYMGPR